MARINALLAHIKEDGEVLHLCVGQAPRLRRRGVLHALPGWEEPMSEAQLRELGQRLGAGSGLGPQGQRLCLRHEGRLLRVQLFAQQHGLAAQVRLWPGSGRLPSLSELVPALSGLTSARGGVVLCTGPAGSGKSTTLAALVAALVPHRRVVALEGDAPHGHAPGVVQRLLGRSEDAVDAVRLALRMGAEVLVIDPVMTAAPGLLPLLLSIQEAGVLLLLVQRAPTLSAALSAWEEGQRERLAMGLHCALHQRLCRGADGGRVLACEVLWGGPAEGLLLLPVLRDGRAAVLRDYMAGSGLSCKTLEESLAELLEVGLISEAEAFAQADDKRRFAHPLVG